MHEFTIRKNSYREVRKKLLMVIIPADLIALAMLLYFSIAAKVEGDNSWFFMLVLFTPVILYTTHQTLKRQKQMFETFRLTITEDALIREQHNTPTITLPKNSIREITRTPEGIFRIFGESNLNGIGVPAQIENAHELERVLSEIRPVVIKPTWTLQVYLQLGALMAVMVGSGIGLLIENRIISTISGIAMCAFLAFGFILIHRSKNYDRRMKRMSYVFVIPFLSIVGWMALQWLGE